MLICIVISIFNMLTSYFPQSFLAQWKQSCFFFPNFLPSVNRAYVVLDTNYKRGEKRGKLKHLKGEERIKGKII